MKKIRNLTIGGIENKVFNLILLTVILLSGIFFSVNVAQDKMVKDLAVESTAAQREAAAAVTEEIMAKAMEDHEEDTAALIAQVNEGISRAEAEAAASYEENTKRIRYKARSIFILAALLILARVIVLGKKIVRPLNRMTKAIAELSQTNLEFKMEDAYRTGDEVEQLAESFAAISHKTVKYLEQIVQVTAEKERVGTELAMATKIQLSMLPHIFPAFPDREEFEIYASMDPAKEVGGDFYDYFLIDQDHLCMVIADVSGKGVPAALFMMASKIILQAVAMVGNSPAEVLSTINNTICMNNEVEMFVTVWLGILELSTGTLRAANAGHEYPVVKHPGGRYELFTDPHGFVVGAMKDMKYKDYEMKLEPGAKLFVYTDGVPEATRADYEMFGTDRMVDALNRYPDAHPEELLAHMREAVDEFVEDAEQFDDLTMLCLEYKSHAEV